jgi:hypothetical protein
MRIIALIIASVTLALVAACEIVIAIPVARWLYVVVAAMFAAGLLRLLPPRQQLGRLRTFAVVCLVLAALHLLPWSSRNGFLKRLYSIKPGMTVEQARAVMAGYMEGTGWPPNPFAESGEPGGELTIAGALVFRHSNDGAYNSDWGIVHCPAGRVTRVEFSAD